MNDIYVIENLNQLNILADPLRVLILQNLRDKPKTASQVAQLIAESPSKISYHFTELERIGAIKLTETRQRRNLIEKYYEPSARFFTVKRDLINSAPDGLGTFYKGVTAILDATILDLHKALETDQMTYSDAEDCFFSYNKVRLDNNQIETFRKKLKALFDEFEAAKNPNASTEAGLTIVLYTSKPGASEAIDI